MSHHPHTFFIPKFPMPVSTCLTWPKLAFNTRVRDFSSLFDTDMASEKLKFQGDGELVMFVHATMERRKQCKRNIKNKHGVLVG
jgi:hypothetical protein